MSLEPIELKLFEITKPLDPFLFGRTPNAIFNHWCEYKGDHLNMLIDYYNKHASSIEIKHEHFRSACINGNLKIAQWLIKNQPQINAEDYLERILPNAASNGYFHIVVFLCSIQQTHIDKHLFPIRFPLRNYDEDDICECDDNYEQCTDKEFLYIHHEYYYDEDEDANGGYFEVYKENVEHIRRKTFIAACEAGHLEIALWIWEMEPDHVYIHDIQQFFVDICRKTQIHVAKWLISEFPSLLNKMEFMFPRICYCSRTKPETIEWLVQIYPSLRFSKIHSPYNNHVSPNLIQKLSEFNITCAKY